MNSCRGWLMAPAVCWSLWLLNSAVYGGVVVIGQSRTLLISAQTSDVSFPAQNVTAPVDVPFQQSIQLNWPPGSLDPLRFSADQNSSFGDNANGEFVLSGVGHSQVSGLLPAGTTLATANSSFNLDFVLDAQEPVDFSASIDFPAGSASGAGVELIRETPKGPLRVFALDQTSSSSSLHETGNLPDAHYSFSAFSTADLTAATSGSQTVSFTVDMTIGGPSAVPLPRAAYLAIGGLILAMGAIYRTPKSRRS